MCVHVRACVLVCARMRVHVCDGGRERILGSMARYRKGLKAMSS